MPVRITYFVHGTTTDNEQRLSSGWNDVALSALGEQQAQALRETLRDQQFDVVFTSDLIRAVRTAKIAFDESIPHVADSRLRECNYGEMNGNTSSVVEPMQEEAIRTPMPGGESYEDVKARIEDFLSMLEHNYDGTHVAIVAHKAPQLALDVIISGKTWEEAFAEDWRKTKAWQPGWEYELA
jgi:broad specificity phosphatase PhoE